MQSRLGGQDVRVRGVFWGMMEGRNSSSWVWVRAKGWGAPGTLEWGLECRSWVGGIGACEGQAWGMVKVGWGLGLGMPVLPSAH